MDFKTIYLTGAPAAGKSTICSALSAKLPDLEIWEYGERLTQYLIEKNRMSLTQTELRSKSSLLAAPEDIQALDTKLLEWIRRNRASKHLLIDSHPVTKETYGFRITAFGKSEIEELSPDELWMLYVPPDVAVDRIRRDDGGRPQIDIESSRMHTILQASIVGTYAVLVGRPLYMFDASLPSEELLMTLMRRLSKS